MNIQSTQIKKGIWLHYLETEKFKTNTLGFYITRPLCRSEATRNSLLSNVLRRGCPLFPDTKGLSGRLDELFGARLVSGVRKKGDLQVIHINFEFANEKFLPSHQPVLENVLNLASSVIFEQTGFSDEYTGQEKENLRQNILSQINDKRSYASIRCTQIMCEGEPYGISELGFEEDIESINSAELFEHYKNILKTSRIDIFVCGSIDISAVKTKLTDALKDLPERTDKYPETIIKKDVGEIKKVTDTEQIMQGKLSLGFRTGVLPTDKNYSAMLVYNAAFGGGPSSKLFNNVREKLSLAYYANSRNDSLKGVMTVNCGIEVENFDKAYNEIMIQADAIKNGDITDDELKAAILSTVNNIKSIADNALMSEDYWLGRLIINTPISMEEIVNEVSTVTKEQIVETAKNIKLDTVYFLKGENK